MKTDLVATGYIIHENKVLLIYHKKLQMWLPVGGHIEENETPDQAMIREAKEEIGLDVNLVGGLDIFGKNIIISKEGNVIEQCAVPFHTNIHNVGDHNHYSLFYICVPKGNVNIIINREEIEDFRWFSKEDLNSAKIHIAIKNLALCAFDLYYKNKKPQKKFGVGFGVMMLNSEGKLLLGRRHEDPDKADSELRGEGTWTMPGGKLEIGEGFEEGAFREVMEETGIKLKDVKVMALNNDINEYAHFVTVGMFCDNFEGEPRVMEPDEITEWRWFGLNEIPENIFSPSKKVLENYKAGEFYLRPKKNIEIELRSFISEEDYYKLLEYFNSNAELVKDDFQETHYFDCEEDLRIQKNNFGAKIWMKKGKIHDDAREEVEIKISEDDFDKIQNIFKILGYNVEIKWLRDRKQFDWEGIKVCLDFTKGYGYIIEMEKIGFENEKEKVLNELKQKFNYLGIPITPREEFEKKYEYYKSNWRGLI